jgi:hypothetical protein
MSTQLPSQQKPALPFEKIELNPSEYCRAVDGPVTEGPNAQRVPLCPGAQRMGKHASTGSGPVPSVLS